MSELQLEERVLPYRVGLCAASVCAVEDATIEEIERAVNQEAPTGISSRWALSEDATFASGEPNPSPCDIYPGRRHYLLNC